MNIEARHTYKENKYSYLLTDITNYKPAVTAFEVGARGFVSKDNKERLKTLHKYCKKNIKLKTFIKNISSLTVNSSYYIFLCRKDPAWSDPPPLAAPFS